MASGVCPSTINNLSGTRSSALNPERLSGVKWGPTDGAVWREDVREAGREVRQKHGPIGCTRGLSHGFVAQGVWRGTGETGGRGCVWRAARRADGGGWEGVGATWAGLRGRRHMKGWCWG